MARLTAVAIVFVSTLLAALLPARAETRMALVIGNAAYENVPQLENPGRDARAIAAALKELGFDTTVVLDQDGSGLKQALRRFTVKAKGADIAAVYYAGHGMEAGGENYLIPVDATLQSDDAIDYELVPLDLVMKAVAGAKQLRLVMLDACRNNPFAAQMAQTDSTRGIGRGFVRVEPANNTLVAYAAKDGTTADDGAGEHSPFASALLKRLPDPGVEVTFLFRRVRDDVLAATGGRQEPFVYGSMGGDPVYLVAAAPAPTPAPIAQIDPKALDFSYWNAIQGSENPSLYEGYLKRFPDGTFTELAKAKLDQLKTSAQKETQTASLAPPPTPLIEPLNGNYVATRATAIRAAPEATAKVRRKLRVDDAVVATGHVIDGDWLRVGEGEAAGYIPMDDLAATEDGEIEAWNSLRRVPTLETAKAFRARFPDSPFKDRVAAIMQELTPPPIEIESLDATYVVKQTANIRAEPNATAKLLGKLAPDQSIAVTGRVKGKDWLRIQQGTDPGYVSAGQLAPINADEVAEWQLLQAKPTFESAQAYMQKYPAGYFKERASALAGKLAPPPPAPPAPEIEPLEGTYVAVQSANIRAEPNASAKAMGRLDEDDAVAVTGKVKDGVWYRVDRDGQPAFVSAKLLRQVDESELKAWRQLTATPKLEAADAFIEQYPSGYFLPKARLLKASLEPEAQPEAAAPAPSVAAVTPSPAPALSPVPSIAAVAPAPASAPESGIKVGKVFQLSTALRTTDPKSVSGRKQYEFNDRIEIVSSAGGGKFIGKARDLPATGDLRITQLDDAVTIEFDTAAGPGEFRLRKLSDGTFSGSGSAYFSVNELGVIRYNGNAQLTPSTSEMQTAAVSPLAGANKIKVGQVYALQATLKYTATAGMSPVVLNGDIEITQDLGGGAFTARATGLAAGNISLVRNGDTLELTFDTTNGETKLRMEAGKPGEYTGKGTGLYSFYWGIGRFSGPAKLTLTSR